MHMYINVEQAIEKSYDLDAKVTMKQVLIIPLGSNPGGNSMRHQTMRSLELPNKLRDDNASQIAEEIVSPAQRTSDHDNSNLTPSTILGKTSMT